MAPDHRTGITGEWILLRKKDKWNGHHRVEWIHEEWKQRGVREGMEERIWSPKMDQRFVVIPRGSRFIQSVVKSSSRPG